MSFSARVLGGELRGIDQFKHFWWRGRMQAEAVEECRGTHEGQTRSNHAIGIIME